MLDLKGHLAPPTIDATAPKLLQQIRANLPSEQFAALIGYPFHFGMLKELGIEPHAFNLDPTDWRPSPVALRPGEHIANARAQGRWEPVLRSPAVAKPRWPVPQVGCSAPTAIACPLLQSLVDLLSSMREVCQVKGVMDFAFLSLLDTYHPRHTQRDKSKQAIEKNDDKSL